MEAELLLQVPGTQLGEGPVWDSRSQRLWWVDILSGMLYEFDPQTKENVGYSIGQYVGAAVPRKSGGFLLALQLGFAFFDPASQMLEPIHDPEEAFPENRFNDGKCDPAGRFWAGTMKIDPPRESVGNLYCLDTDLSITCKKTQVCISNGLAWDAAHKHLYYIDTLTQSVLRYNYDLTSGEISNPETALTFSGDNWPDGMCIDVHDHLWIAFYGAGKVICYDPVSGDKLAEIRVPAKNTTSCAFGGENLDQLFITSAAADGDPWGGGVFVVEPGVGGRHAYFFGG